MAIVPQPVGFIILVSLNLPAICKEILHPDGPSVTQDAILVDHKLCSDVCKTGLFGENAKVGLVAETFNIYYDYPRRTLNTSETAPRALLAYAFCLCVDKERETPTIPADHVQPFSRLRASQTPPNYASGQKLQVAVCSDRGCRTYCASLYFKSFACLTPEFKPPGAWLEKSLLSGLDYCQCWNFDRTRMTRQGDSLPNGLPTDFLDRFATAALAFEIVKCELSDPPFE